MPSLLSVTIDAGVLAVPHVNCGKDIAFQYVDTLLDWSKLLDEPWVAIYMSERASESLFADGLYPLRDQLRKLFDTHGIVEYDVNTVAKIANQLLKLTPSFETYYRVKDVLSEHLETVPDVIHLTTHNDLQYDLARCITLIAILRKHCSQPLGGHSLILRKAPKQVIQLRVHIHEIEHTRDDIPVLPCPPNFFEGDVLVCDDFRGLIDCLNESAILVDASDNLGVELAVRVALFKNNMVQGDFPDWDCVIVPTIGPDLGSCANKFAPTKETLCQLRFSGQSLRLSRGTIFQLYTRCGQGQVEMIRKECVEPIKRSVEISTGNSIFITGSAPTGQSNWRPLFITTIFQFRNDVDAKRMALQHPS